MHKKNLAKFDTHLLKKKKRNRKIGIEETASKSIYQKNHTVSTMLGGKATVQNKVRVATDSTPSNVVLEAPAAATMQEKQVRTINPGRKK